jgi:glycine/D-amino acid oxidase-like deaminating enzyme
LECEVFAGSPCHGGLRTAAGLLQAEHYVLASGWESPAHARQLGLRIPVYPLKGYSITVDIPTDHTQAAPRVSVTVKEGGNTLLQVADDGCGVRVCEQNASARRLTHVRRAVRRRRIWLSCASATRRARYGTSRTWPPALRLASAARRWRA